MKKKKKLIFLGIIIFIIIIVIIRFIIINNTEKNSINDFSSVKELIEYDGHKYITMQNSTDEEYDKDIYLIFSKPTINNDGTTNKNLYEIVISHVAGKLKGQNFRMIDQEKNICISIKFNEDGEVSYYTINNDGNYWEHIKTNYQIDNYSEEQITNAIVESSILENIINANWIYKNVNLGSMDSKVDNYEIYYDEGYKVKKIGSEIYNIVFTKNYAQEIITSITTTTSVENVENILGKPTYEDSTLDVPVIGYKCQDFYIFFSDDEVSVYHPDKYNENDSKSFGKLVTELNETGDMNTFLNKLTDLYPNYNSFYTDDGYVNIVYSLQGFEVTFGAPKNNGITIYNNFKGNVTNDITIEDIRENKKIPANVYTKLETNLVYDMEGDRTQADNFNRNPYDEAYLVQTNEYTVRRSENNYSFYSRNKNKIDSLLAISNLTNMISYDEHTFIYGVKNDGIYIYDAEQMKTNKVVEGQGNFNIEKLEENVIYYDGKQINL